jgi:hypothetical protein
MSGRVTSGSKTLCVVVEGRDVAALKTRAKEAGFTSLSAWIRSLMGLFMPERRGRKKIIGPTRPRRRRRMTQANLPGIVDAATTLDRKAS